MGHLCVILVSEDVLSLINTVSCEIVVNYSLLSNTEVHGEDTELHEVLMFATVSVLTSYG